MSPVTDATAAAPRPAVLDRPADKAAHEVFVGRPCPVCGATLLERSARGPQPLLTHLAVAYFGLLGHLATRPHGCRCGQCDLSVPLVPHRGLALVNATVIALAGMLLVAFGASLALGHPTGASLIACIVAITAGLASPFYAVFSFTRPWNHLAAKIARARQRWSETRADARIQIDAEALLRKARLDATCPVCEDGKLAGPAPNALWSRGGLACSRCKIEIPMTLTPVGRAAGLLGAAVMLAIGVGALWGARGAEGNGMVLRFALGAVLGLGGIYLGFLVQGSGDDAARRDLERGRRLLERRRLGLPVRDEEEEPAVWFQENLEAVVVAFILALVIRHFVMEAFVIPTGSMAPTLLGDHFQVECRNCHYKFAVQKIEGRIGEGGEDVAARCPLCGIGAPENEFTFHAPDVRGGNKILVNKFIYKLEPPDRFQVVVFKFPKNPSRNFIKRLVGLPEETIKIDGRGDVWIKPKNGDKFVLARKPASVQEELWFPVYDARWPDPRAAAWKPSEQPERWQSSKRADGSEEWTAKPGTGEAWLSYAREIRDWYGYNKGWGSGSKPVGDLRVKARITPGADSKTVKLAVVENERALVAELPVGTGDTATIGSYAGTGRTIARQAPMKPLRAGSASEVSLAYSDERVTLTVNGAVVLAWDDPTAPAWTDTSSVRLGADAGGAVFDDVKVDRDIVYVPSHGGHPEFDPTSNEVKVPESCYFMMGDNSPNSQDGREWGFVHEPHLIGRAFLVFWPLDEVKLIR